MDYGDVITKKMAETEQKAWEALARYKFWMFGYYAARWVTYREILEEDIPNPFSQLVKMGQARVVKKQRG